MESRTMLVYVILLPISIFKLLGQYLAKVGMTHYDDREWTPARKKKLQEVKTLSEAATFFGKSRFADLQSAVAAVGFESKDCQIVSLLSYPYRIQRGVNKKDCSDAVGMEHALRAYFGHLIDDKGL